MGLGQVGQALVADPLAAPGVGEGPATVRDAAGAGDDFHGVFQGDRGLARGWIGGDGKAFGFDNADYQA